MKTIAVFSVALLLAYASTGSAADDNRGPRTGYVKIAITPQDLLGDAGASAVSSLFDADASPINERMVKALLARAVAEEDYAIDASRIYVSGFSGGAHIATMLASSKPGPSYFDAAIRFLDARAKDGME